MTCDHPKSDGALRCKGCAQKYRREQFRSALTSSQRSALRFIARRPDAQLKEIAFELGVGLSSAAGFVERLRLKGLIAKQGRMNAVTHRGSEMLAAQLQH